MDAAFRDRPSSLRRCPGRRGCRVGLLRERLRSTSRRGMRWGVCPRRSRGRRMEMTGTWQQRRSHLLNEGAHIEELLTCDHVVLHRVESDFCVRAALAPGFGGEADRAVDGKPAGVGVGVAAEERPTEVLALDGVVALKDLRLVDDRLLADGFLAIAFDGYHLRRVHR